MGIQAANWHQISGGVNKAANKPDKKKKVLRYLIQYCTEIKLYSIQYNITTGTWEHKKAKQKKRKVNTMKSYIFGCNFIINKLCEFVWAKFNLYKKSQILGIIKT